jgi:YbbR domain-containing protein
MEANLRSATVGVSEVPMRVAGVPLSLSVAPGYPATARVELDKIIERERPVHDVIRGEPARGFVIEEVTLDPAEVTVRGATSVVREVARAVVVVDVSGMNQSASFDVEVEARDNRNLSVSGVHFEPKTVSVTVQVRELNVKYVPVRPVLGSPAPGYQVAGVRTDPEIVTVTSDRGLGNVSSVATLRVDISGLRGSKGYSVPLNVPEGLQVEGPASVQVTVTTQPLGGGGPEPPPQEPQPEDAQDAGPDQSGGTEAGQDSDASPENQQTEPVGENDGGADEADASNPQPEPADEEPAAEEDDNATTPTPTQGDGA